MRLLLLIIGLVLGSYLLFTALAKSRLRRYAKFHEEFDQTLLENSHSMLRAQSQPHQEDPLLEIEEEPLAAATQSIKSRTVVQEKVLYTQQYHRPEENFKHPSAASEPYAWETALTQEEIEETITAEPTPTSAFSTHATHEAWQEPADLWENEAPSSPKPAAQPQDFIALSILPKNRMGFTGHTLLSALKVNYFYYGKQKIFNRHLGDDPHQPVLFSVASLLEPGVFDQAHMSKNVFPGIIIFMLLPCATNALTTFEKMFTTARQLADSLNADLCDMSRNPLNIHTLRQYRDRIRANPYVRFSQGV